MGTNFYINGLPGVSMDDPRTHIGKRSAAGMYCWDCKRTLCKTGEADIHVTDPRDNKWSEVCLSCGKGRAKESLEDSTAGRELGFNKNTPTVKSGVRSCSSFTWAQEPAPILSGEKFGEKFTCPACDQPIPKSADGKVIVDEYGRLFTLDEFKGILDECPVQYTYAVGTSFS